MQRRRFGAADVPDPVARELSSAGFEHHGREWFHEEGRAILEFRAGGLAPGEGAAAVRVGSREVLCLGREELLINRLASWSTWSSPVDGLNAYYLLVRPKPSADPARLEALARAASRQA